MVPSLTVLLWPFRKAIPVWEPVRRVPAWHFQTCWIIQHTTIHHPVLLDCRREHCVFIPFLLLPSIPMSRIMPHDINDPHRQLPGDLAPIVKWPLDSLVVQVCQCIIGNEVLVGVGVPRGATENFRVCYGMSQKVREITCCGIIYNVM